MTVPNPTGPECLAEGTLNWLEGLLGLFAGIPGAILDGLASAFNRTA